jgi:nucleoside-triphosphatase THEP1
MGRTLIHSGGNSQWQVNVSPSLTQEHRIEYSVINLRTGHRALVASKNGGHLRLDRFLVAASPDEKTLSTQVADQ